MMRGFRISPSMAVVAVLVILTLLGAWRYDGFIGPYNVQTVLRYTSMFALVALGMCFVIMTGGIDLSVGSVAAFSSVVAAHLSPYGLLPGLVGGLAAGLLAGLINALIITKLRILPFIATLGMMMLLKGLSLVVSGTKPIYFSDVEQFGIISQASLIGSTKREAHLLDRCRR